KRAAGADVIITTAQLRGRPAPKIITEEIVSKMTSGSVIVDLAASTGGNCVFTEDGKTILHDQIHIIGDSFLADSMPQTASELYANNVVTFMELFVKGGEVTLDME